MTSNSNIDLSSDLEALRASVSIDNASDLDLGRTDRASMPNFNELRYLDTRPTQHMTATWGS
jgi:hypothetical protein